MCLFKNDLTFLDFQCLKKKNSKLLQAYTVNGFSQGYIKTSLLRLYKFMHLYNLHKLIRTIMPDRKLIKVMHFVLFVKCLQRNILNTHNKNDKT